MTKMLIRRVPAVVLTVAILFTTVFALSISASALTFTPRYSMPSGDNEYYYSDMNPFYPAGYGLPNCTAYAYGRVYEITGKKPNLSTGNAENWYGYNQSNGYYSYGQTPRLGAIACWSYGGNGGGHVAVVEYINTSTGEMILSNSAWSARYGSCEPFYLTKTTVDDPQAGGSSWWYFQGYIYAVDTPDVVNTGTTTGGGNSPVVIGGGDDNGDDTPSAGKNYEKGVYQVQVDDYLTMRTGAGTRYSFVTRVLDGAKLQVTAVKKNDDLTWGETSYDGWDGWVALNYCKYLGSLDTWKEEPVPTEAPTEEPTTAAPATAAPTQPATTIAEIPTEEPTTVPVVTAAPTTVAPATAASATVPEIPEVPTEAPATQAATEPDYSKGIGTGDINADGVIDVVDATLIQKAAAGLGNLSAKQLKWCDFDFDGKITISDATLVQKIATGMYNYYL